MFKNANNVKMQIAFKNKTRLGNKFHFKDRIAKDRISGAVYKFQCVDSAMSPIMVNVWDIWM